MPPNSYLSSIRIGFKYKGQRLYETVASEITKKTVMAAIQKRDAVLYDIDDGEFDYIRHFPDSSKALKFVNANASLPTVTFGRMLEDEAEFIKLKKAPSTVSGELNSHKMLLKYFSKNMQVSDFTVHEIKLFMLKSRKKYSAKTVNNAMTPLRSVLKRAYAEGILSVALHDKVSNFDGEETRPEKDVDPLTLDELRKFEAIDYRSDDKRMFMFNMWTGLSFSELVGLSWTDIDRDGKVPTLHVKRAYVTKDFKVPKEKSRNRIIELNDKALKYLDAQRAVTELRPPIEIDALQRDNVGTKKEVIKPIFLNSYNKQLWTNASANRVFSSICKKAEIRHRGPNNCRHTFASRMITLGMNLEILAQLMGHTGTEMLFKHYADIINEDRSGQIAEMQNRLIADL